MKIWELKVINFRNFGEKIFYFGGGFNLIYGGNGRGKTSILEAISYLSLPRSRRGARDEELVKWGEKHFLLKGRVERLGVNHNIEISWHDGKKNVRVDNKQISSYSELFRVFVTLYFSMKEQNWVDGPPSIRRKLVDWYLSIKDPEYYEVLLRYRRNVAHKNLLLKNGKEVDLIAIYNDKIEKDGSYIVKKRLEAINEFNSFLENDPLGEGVRVVYTPSIEPREGVLKEKLEEEIKTGSSLYGPHRDRLEFTFRGRNPRTSASEGEKRLIGLALLLKIRDSLTEILGEVPPLLLDEPFSILEYDNTRRVIDELKEQVFITAVKEVPLDGVKIEL